MKTYKIGIGAIVMFALGYGTCFHLNPQTITLDDYQLLNGDFVEQLKQETCLDETLAVRKELEDKFQTALAEREVQCGQWEVCDCTDNVTIIESNCDTSDLEFELEQTTDILRECSDANEELSIQVRNLMYQ